ncbi:MAG: universal stress protein [Oligoflexia bacterium]|nr:universal stress protein [Oligoflexia bacterium]
MPQLFTRKIIWAVDVLEEPGLQERAAETIRALARKERLELDAVFLPILAHLRLPALDLSGPWLEEYREQAEMSLSGLLERYGLAAFGRPVMIERNFASTLDAVRALSDYAKEAGASLILASTHGRTGLGRLLLGSFAETLLQYSEVPVMTVGPQNKGRSEIDTILFPTDFSREGRWAYRQVVELGARFGAEVVLYHALQPSMQQFMQSESYLLTGTWMPGAMPAAVETDDGLARAEKRARKWVAWAGGRGVRARFVIDEGVGSVADAILAAARKQGCELIAIEAESGPMTAMLLGSVTRQVVRHAEAPVMVFRPVKSAAAELPSRSAA